MLERHGRTLAIAVSVFAIGLDGGGYTLGARSAIAAVVWAIIVAAAALMRRRPPVPAAALAAGTGVLAYTLITGLSTQWSDSAELSFVEFDRALLYLGVFVAVMLLARPREARQWMVGLGAGAAAVCFLALAARCFPSLGLNDSLNRYLPAAGGRLAYPIGYWNGLGILAALAVPLLLGAATSAGHRVARGAALAPVPALAATMYLTSSRGALAVAVVACVALLALNGRSVLLIAALVVGAAGSAIAVGALVSRGALADHPGSAAAASQGHGAAAFIVLACLACGAAYALGSRFVEDLSLSRRTALVSGVLVLAVAIGGVIAADPAARLRSFKAPPPGISHPSTSFVTGQHLLSGNGSGRWQFWGAALSEFRSRPFAGRGAGSYEAWWTRHEPFYFPARNAHSLWLETLGELGIIGFLPLAAAFAIALVTGVRRMRGRSAQARAALAAVTATLIAWIVAAALDWIWELTAVGVIGVVCMALLTASASAPSTPRLEARGIPVRAPVLAGVCVVALLVLAAEGLPWLTQEEIASSQSAIRDGNTQQAITRALDARALQPWAASPYLQLALSEEVAGNVRAARQAIKAAIHRDRSDWKLWLVYTRIEARAAHPRRALRGLSHVRRLDPLLPLFTATR